MIVHYNPYFEAFKTASERLLDHDNITLHLKTIDPSRSTALQSIYSFRDHGAYDGLDGGIERQS